MKQKRPIPARAHLFRFLGPQRLQTLDVRQRSPENGGPRAWLRPEPADLHEAVPVAAGLRGLRGLRLGGAIFGGQCLKRTHRNKVGVVSLWFPFETKSYFLVSIEDRRPARWARGTLENLSAGFPTRSPSSALLPFLFWLGGIPLLK